MCVGCKWFDLLDELVQGAVRSVVQFRWFLFVCGVFRSDVFYELPVKVTSFRCNWLFLSKKAKLMKFAVAFFLVGEC